MAIAKTRERIYRSSTQKQEMTGTQTEREHDVFSNIDLQEREFTTFFVYFFHYFITFFNTIVGCLYSTTLPSVICVGLAYGSNLA